MTGFSFRAPPTLRKFMLSEAFGRIALGPIGSAKTTACIMEVLRRCQEQAPADDGIRYSRWAIARQTLKQLKDTVLRDIQSWFTQYGLGYYRTSESVYYLNFGDVSAELFLIPLEDVEDQARLLSMQLTGAWMSELIEMDRSILAPLTGRLGRYPSGPKGTCTWYGLIADTNQPTEMTPWWEFMENLPTGWQKFVQPSGLSPEAENLNYLLQTEETIKLPIDHPARLARGRRYYEQMVEMHGVDSDWVKRYVMAQYGNDPSGLGVFRESWSTDFHTVEDTMVIPGHPLLVGQDFGRNPWSLIGQVDHMGRVLVHQEVPAANIGLEKHVNEHLKPILLSEKFIANKIAVVGDPSGAAKGSISEESNFDALTRMGLPSFPAVTNLIDPRLRAVEGFLTRHVGGKPSMVVSQKGCPYLIRGMSGGYRYTRTKQGLLRPVPNKDEYSHVADCLQYISLVAGSGMMDVIASRLRPHTKKDQRSKVSAAAWT